MLSVGAVVARRGGNSSDSERIRGGHGGDGPGNSSGFCHIGPARHSERACTVEDIMATLLVVVVGTKVLRSS